MVEEKRLDQLFYELASQDRLAILTILCNQELKMQDVARKLDLTATEASRQLQRLSQTKMLDRNSNGEYYTTSFGRLLLTLSGSMQVAYRHSDYFLTHDATKLPPSFVNRLSDLSGATLVTDLTEALTRWEKLVKNAENHLWVMTPQVMSHLSKAMTEKLTAGIKVRSIFSEGIKESKEQLPSAKTVERRLLPNMSLIVMVSECEASVSFPKLDGSVDFASFFGCNPLFMGFASDLYGHYWGQAKMWP